MHCQSCSKRSDDDCDDAFNDDGDQNDAFDDEDEALDDEEHHFLGLDKGLGVVDNRQA